MEASLPSQSTQVLVLLFEQKRSIIALSNVLRLCSKVFGSSLFLGVISMRVAKRLAESSV